MLRPPTIGLSRSRAIVASSAAFVTTVTNEEEPTGFRGRKQSPRASAIVPLAAPIPAAADAVGAAPGAAIFPDYGDVLGFLASDLFNTDDDAAKTLFRDNTKLLQYLVGPQPATCESSTFRDPVPDIRPLRAFTDPTMPLKTRSRLLVELFSDLGILSSHRHKTLPDGQSSFDRLDFAVTALNVVIEKAAMSEGHHLALVPSDCIANVMPALLMDLACHGAVRSSAIVGLLMEGYPAPPIVGALRFDLKQTLFARLCMVLARAFGRLFPALDLVRRWRNEVKECKAARTPLNIKETVAEALTLAEFIEEMRPVLSWIEGAVRRDERAFLDQFKQKSFSLFCRARSRNRTVDELLADLKELEKVIRPRDVLTLEAAVEMSELVTPPTGVVDVDHITSIINNADLRCIDGIHSIKDRGSVPCFRTADKLLKRSVLEALTLYLGLICNTALNSL